MSPIEILLTSGTLFGIILANVILFRIFAASKRHDAIFNELKTKGNEQKR